MKEQVTETQEIKPFFSEEIDWLREQIGMVVRGEKLVISLAKETSSGKESKTMVKIGKKTAWIVPDGFLKSQMGALTREFGGEKPKFEGRGWEDVHRDGVFHFLDRSIYRLPGKLDVAICCAERRKQEGSKLVYFERKWWVANIEVSRLSLWDEFKLRLRGSF